MAKSIEILAEKERKKEESKQALEVLKKGRKTIWQKEKFFNLKLPCHLNVFFLQVLVISHLDLSNIKYRISTILANVKW